MTLALAVLGVAGCGGGPSTASVESAKPPLTIPNDPVTPGDGGNKGATSTTDSTGGTNDNTGGDTGGTTPDNTGGNDTGGTNDNAGNTNGDNTGAGNGGQQYDQFCQENPGACGD